jgi:hypothetical protein
MSAATIISKVLVEDKVGAECYETDKIEVAKGARDNPPEHDV